MKFLGIGPAEFILIFFIAILILGPDGIVGFSQKIGQFIRDFRKSEMWQVIRGSRQSITKISQELVAESGIEEIKSEIEELNAMRDESKNIIEESLLSSEISDTEKK